ncbi:TPA: glycosyltransferase, partial [Enterococcus faecium]|nr:glycosyltransferase [Enterococcus faecium]
MCRISIIVPVYNVEKYLKKCVDSILGQTFTDFELLLIDDGSTDNSGSICDELAKTDNRIKVIHKENGGLSDARNIGIEVAKGDFIGFIDSDDYIDEDMYAFLYNN